jgi:uncharacterized coiled-coil protein SlyX
MIDKILDFSKHHAQTVIATLFGVIVVGSVGGGLWIHNLQSVLDESQRLEDQRLAAQKQDFDNNMSAIKIQVSEEDRALHELSAKVAEQNDVLEHLAERLEQLANSGKSLRQVKFELLATAADLRFSGVALKTKVSEATVARVDLIKPYPMLALQAISSWVVYLISVLLVVVTIVIPLILWWAFRARRERKLAAAGPPTANQP